MGQVPLFVLATSISSLYNVKISVICHVIPSHISISIATELSFLSAEALLYIVRYKISEMISL